VTARLDGHALRLQVAGAGPLDVVIHGALEKTDLLERTFGLKAEIVPATGN